MLLVRPSRGRQRGGSRRTSWIFGPRADLLIALCWVPLWLLGHWMSAGHGPHHDALLRSAVGATFLLSFAHQPLTLGLVYGDANQFVQRRRLFMWAPPVAIAAIVVAVTMHLWLIIPIAAIWNTVHTLQQRYGLSRIYGRKGGYGSARLDRWVLYAWMGAAVLAVAARPGIPDLIRRVGLDGINAGGVRLLTDLRPWALAVLVPMGLTAIALTAAIILQEAAQAGLAAASVAAAASPAAAGVSAAPAPPGPSLAPANGANPAKWLYQVSSLLLIASIAVDPAAGFIAYVGAHAIEYFVVVYKTTETRYGRHRDGSSLLGRAAYRPAGRIACFAAVVALALFAHGRLDGAIYTVTLYTVGVLHFLYDGFIWKLRRPAVAADFAIAPPASATA